MTQDIDEVTKNNSKQADRLCVTTQTTNAYRKIINLAEERRIRQVKLAGARVDVDKVGPPAILIGLEHSSPCPGIHRIGADAFVEVNGCRFRGDKAMRDALGIRSAVDLIREAETQAQGSMWTGLGNAGLNQYCPIWRAGRLYYSVQDIPLIENHWEFDACLWLKGVRWEVRFERVQFVSNGSTWEPLVGGQLIRNAELVICGQRLVERGTAIDPADDAESRYASSYVDKRHLIRNPFTRLIDRTKGTIAKDENGNPINRDFGLDQILKNPAWLSAAIEGESVKLRLELEDVDGVSYGVTPVDLTAALEEKSYQGCDTLEELKERQGVGERGLYYLDEVERICHLVYHRSLYPLHFLAARENGDTVLIDATIGGFSNNAGCTLDSLAKDLRSCGLKEALLLDNGGDVVLVHRGQHAGGAWPDPNGRCAIVPSSLKRTQWAALMLYQGQADGGIQVRCDSEGSDGRLCIEWD